MKNQNASQQHRRDAGSLFVLKSKGSWIHCGYHLTTSIVSPSLLSLPYALTFLGWKAGIFCLVIGAFVSFYSFNLMSLVLEHHAYLGNRHLLYRDMARDILGKSSNGPEKDYSLIGDTTNRLFGIFNAIPIIANTYGSGIVPEIQAKLAPPVEGKMLKGLVAISGLWAFGYQAAGLIFSHFIDDYSKPLAPKWLIYLPNICTIAQLLANGVEYLQPTNVILEQIFGDSESTEFSPRNVMPRLVSLVHLLYMDALWLPLDNINCGSTTPKSSICFHLPRMDNRNTLLGPRWDRFFVGPIQFAVCYSAEVLCPLLGGQCMKAMYLLSNPNGSMKLYQFVVIFGCFMLILAQIPSFHSLRHINLVSLVLCLAYSACATTASIYIGNTSKGPEKDYSLKGDTTNRLFGIFNAIAIIATTYGNGIVPEIQATLAPPVKGKMFKGLCVCYAVLIFTFFSVAISGYWAFGNQAAGLILSNFVDNGKPLVPKWFIYMTNIFTITQLSAVGVVYLQPTNVVLEQTFGDPESPEFSPRNVIPRLISRSLAIITAATIAAMLPFFGDINSLIGAFGFMPLDFILPVVFFNVTFKPSKRSLIYWLNVTIAVAFSALGAISAVAAVRQIVLDAKTYRLFANLYLQECMQFAIFLKKNRPTIKLETGITIERNSLNTKIF
ncbi:GABA transporter 1 [Glycine soja]